MLEQMLGSSVLNPIGEGDVRPGAALVVGIGVERHLKALLAGILDEADEVMELAVLLGKGGVVRNMQRCAGAAGYLDDFTETDR